MIQAFERARTLHALDGTTTTVISRNVDYYYYYYYYYYYCCCYCYVSIALCWAFAAFSVS
jgi:hypothetical protein